jgi:hypothetical protein
MPSLLGSTVAANYGTMKSSENYTVDGSNVRTYTGPFTQFGTRQLKFLKITAVHDGAAVNFSTTYTAANSDYSVAVRAIQNVAEVYAVGTPDATGFIAIIAADTANGSDTATGTQPITTGYGVLEAAIKAAVEADTSATVVELTFDGVAIS